MQFPRKERCLRFVSDARCRIEDSEEISLSSKLKDMMVFGKGLESVDI